MAPVAGRCTPMVSYCSLVTTISPCLFLLQLCANLCFTPKTLIYLLSIITIMKHNSYKGLVCFIYQRNWCPQHLGKLLSFLFAFSCTLRLSANWLSHKIPALLLQAYHYLVSVSLISLCTTGANALQVRTELTKRCPATCAVFCAC